MSMTPTDYDRGYAQAIADQASTSDLVKLAQMIDEAANEAWWGRDAQLKYLRITIDTRDAEFTLMDRDGNIVEVDRVERAIANHRKRFGKLKLRK